MNAIEFQTTITNSFVPIPNYKEFENKQVKIIVIDNSASLPQQQNKHSFIALLTQKPIHISSDTAFYSRNEANER